VLLAVAALQAVAGFVYWCFYSDSARINGLEWLFVFSAPIYIVLSYFARRFPQFSLFFGFGLESSFMIYLAFLPNRGPIVWDGRILNAPIFALFAWALWTEIAREQKRRNLPPIKFEVKSLTRTTVYFLGIVGSVLTLITVNSNFSSMTRFFMVEVSLLRKASNETLNSFAKQAQLDLLLSAIAGGVLAICVFGFGLELAKQWRNAKGPVSNGLNLNSTREP
jgi:hypothetical protein